MPTSRKKRTIIEETVPETSEKILDGEGPSELDVALESVEDAEALDEVLSQFGETRKLLKIFRQTTAGPEFCYPAEHLDEEFIQKNFGGGDYTARIFINGRYRRSLSFKIANRLPQPSENPAVSSRTNDAFLEKLVLALVSRPMESTLNPPSIAELTSALANLDSLRGKQESAMDLFLKGVEFANGRPSGDWKSDAIGMIRDALPVALPIVNKVIGGQPPQVPVEPNPLAVPPVEPINDQTRMDNLIREGLTFLKNQAISGLEPESVINWVSSNGNNPQYQPFIRAVLSNEFSKFVDLDPEIGTGPFMPWFKFVYDGLRSALNPADSVDVDTAGTVGDNRDTGNDVPTSANGSNPKRKGK